jgi:predicted oxidoreductase
VACARVLAQPARPVPLVDARSQAHIREAAGVRGVALGRSDCYLVLEAARGECLP